MVYEKIEKYLYVSSPAKVREKVEKTGDENNFVKIYTSKDHAQNASNIYSATLVIPVITGKIVVRPIW